MISYYGASQLTPDHAISLFTNGRGGRAFVVRDNEVSGEPVYFVFQDPSNRTYATWLKALFNTPTLQGLIEDMAADCLGDFA